MTKQDDQEQQDDDLIAELGYIKVEVVKDHKSRTKYRHCTGEYNDLSVGLMAKILALIHSERERAVRETVDEVEAIDNNPHIVTHEDYAYAVINWIKSKRGLTTKEERHQREADRNL